MNSDLTFVVVKRDVPHPDPAMRGTVSGVGDVLRLNSSDGLSFTWWGEASLYETDEYPDARHHAEELALAAFEKLRQRREQE